MEDIMKKQWKIRLTANARAYLLKIQSKCFVDQGFTLVELLVVVAILAVLATLVIPSYNYLVEKAKISACTGDIRTLEKSIAAYAVEKGDLPGSLNVLTDLTSKNLIDPWGNAFQYKNLVTNPAAAIEDQMTGALNGDFDLYSMGPNGASAKVFDASGADDIVRSGDGAFVGLRP